MELNIIKMIILQAHKLFQVLDLGYHNDYSQSKEALVLPKEIFQWCHFGE